MSVIPAGTNTVIVIPGGYKTLFEWDITFETDPSPDGIFAAMQCYLNLSDGAMYAGVQTRCTDVGGPGVHGKGVVFSCGGGGGLLQGSGQIVESGFDEVVGIATRCAYDWTVGETLHLKIEQTLTVDGQLWDFSVNDFPLLAILVPTELGWGNLAGPAWFLERYSGPVDACSSIQYARVRMENFTADGSEVATYGPNTLTDGSTCTNSRITAIA